MTHLYMNTNMHPLDAKLDTSTLSELNIAICDLTSDDFVRENIIRVDH